MRECIKTTFDWLIKAKTPIILVNTYEEEAFIRDLCEYAYSSAYDLVTWSMASGMDKYDTVNKQIVSSVPGASFMVFANTIDAKQNPKNNDNSDDNADSDDSLFDSNTDKKNVIFVIKDAHAVYENNNTIIRKIRDLKEYRYKVYCPLILMTPVTSIPLELEKIVTVFNYDLPNKEEVTLTVNGLISALKKKNEADFVEPDTDTVNATINSLMGLTSNEIRYILMRSAMQYNTLNLDLISQCKVNMVEKSGLLDYVVPKISFDDIGGNEPFKEWIDDVSSVLTDSAKDFGCEVPKGYMALGIAGTGKTVIAEAIAKKLGVPMFIFNVSKIFDKLVGQSEKKIEQALRIVKSSAPCVLLFDEAEKIFGGYGGSDCDGGTSSRVFSSILRFLAENDKVFIVMTSNDVRKLPPELTRSGRLDTTWYFSFPTFSERKDIFRIHFAKAGRTDIDQDILTKAAKKTNNFTGAEIKNVVKQAIWQSYKRYKETNENTITIDDIEYAISKVVPTYKTSKEKIDALERYARGRALFANNSSENKDVNDFDDDELLRALDK